MYFAFCFRMQSLSCAILSSDYFDYLKWQQLKSLSFKHLVHASMAVEFSRKCLLSNTSYKKTSQKVNGNTEFTGNRLTIGGEDEAVLQTTATS